MHTKQHTHSRIPDLDTQKQQAELWLRRVHTKKLEFLTRFFFDFSNITH